MHQAKRTRAGLALEEALFGHLNVDVLCVASTKCLALLHVMMLMMTMMMIMSFL